MELKRIRETNGFIFLGNKMSSPIGFRPITTNLLKNVETYVNSSYYIYLIDLNCTSADLKWMGKRLGIRSVDMSDFARAVQSRLRDWSKRKAKEVAVGAKERTM